MGYVAEIILAVIAIACFVISFFQFHEKGFLLNNAYLYASKQERETMNKKPHYRQSGIVFLIIGIIFAINAIEIIIKTGWLFYVMLAVAVVTIVYAVVSSVSIEKKRMVSEQENKQ